MLMENLYKDLLRQTLLEQAESSEEKYQKDIDRIKNVAELVVVNSSKFTVDFFRYLIKKAEPSQFTDPRSIGELFIKYVAQLLSAEVDQVSSKSTKHSNDFGVNVETHFKLPFTRFSVKCYLKLVENKGEDKGEFPFDIDVEDSVLYLTPEKTDDTSFNISDEPKQYDILTYKESAYKGQELSNKVSEFREDYENTSTENFLEDAWDKLLVKKGNPKSETDLEKFCKTFMQVTLKYLSLTAESPIHYRNGYSAGRFTSVKTEIGTIIISSTGWEITSPSLQSVSFTGPTTKESFKLYEW